MRAWHFLKENMTPGQGYEDPWKIGETRSVKAKIVPCEHGYHSSPTIWDAVKYAPGPILCRVEIGDEYIPHGNPTDKHVSRSRTLISAVDVSKQLRLFAADCAEHVLHLYEGKYPDDKRPRKAIEAARRFAKRPTKKNRDAANAAFAAAFAAAAFAAAFAAANAAFAAAFAAANAANAAANAAAEKNWQKERFDFYFAEMENVND